MTDVMDRTMSAEAVMKAPIGRRTLLAGCGVATVAGAAGFAAPAFAASGIKTFEGRYGFGARLIKGYFASPRGSMDCDVVVVVPEQGKVTAATRALARKHAAQGRLAVVPDLAETYGDAALFGVSAMKAALMADKASYRRFAHGSHRVTFVAA